MPTWWSSARASAARPRPRRWPAEASTCSCSSAASGCPASPRTGRRARSSSSAGTSRPRPGTTAAAGRSHPACTTWSAATARSTAPACPASGSTTSAPWSTTRASLRRGPSATPTSSRTTPRPSASTGCTAPLARTRPSPGAARPTRTPRSRTSRTSRTSPTGCGARVCTPAPTPWVSTAGRAAAASAAAPATASPAGSARRATPRPALSTRRSPRPGCGWRPAPGCAASSPTAPAGGSTISWSRGRTGGDVVRGGRFVLAAGAVNSAALLLASADDAHPEGVANASGLVGSNFMMHNNAHVAAIDLNRRNDVTFQKTLSVNDWYVDGGDGRPLGTMQLIGRVDEVMMKSWATYVPLPLLRAIAGRSVEWLVMSEDLPHPRQPGHRRRRGPDHDNAHRARSRHAPAAAQAGQGATAGGRLRRGVHPVVRHQHEQPPVRDRRGREPTRLPACSTRGAAATTSRTSGSSTAGSSRRRRR